MVIIAVSLKSFFLITMWGSLEIINPYYIYIFVSPLNTDEIYQARNGNKKYVAKKCEKKKWTAGLITIEHNPPIDFSV